jgi:hypothetical protein
MTAEDTIRLTATFLRDPDNWIQGEFQDGHKRCLDGALQDFAPSGRVYREAEALLTETLPAGPWSLTCFNDHTSHAEVIGLLDGVVGRAPEVERAVELIA